MSLCVQRSRRAQLAQSHMLINYIRLVSWHYLLSKSWSSDCGGLGPPFCPIRMSCLIKLFNTSSKFQMLTSKLQFFIYNHLSIHSFILILIDFVPFPLSSPRQIRLVWLICCWDCYQQQWALVTAVAFVDGYDRFRVFSLLIFQNQSMVAMVEQHSIHSSCRRMLLCTGLCIVWSSGNPPFQAPLTSCRPRHSWR